MITEGTLRQDPELVKLLTGLPAEVFWQLVEKAQEQAAAYEQERHQRPNRQRAVGGGRPFDLPLAIRISMLLTYLRLHITQALVGKLFGGTQSDVSRELRRLLPLLKQVLPCPSIWQLVEEKESLSEEDCLQLSDLADGQVLIDATEQEVYRSQDNLTRKAHYSGKKKDFTLKTQMVTDGEHHIQAISEAVPGAKHDKKLSDETNTVERLPDDCQAKADKGYQGMAEQVSMVTIIDLETNSAKEVPRLTLETPFKKPKGSELTQEQKDFNHLLNSIRVRVEHCIGWVKNWRIMDTCFRCAHQIYSAVMQVVCGLVNWQTQRWQTAKASG